MTTATRRRGTRRPISAEERSAQVEALAQQLNEAVSRITTDEAWTAMLQTAARFHRHSFRNVVLLWAQAEARGMTLSQVAGFRTWMTLGRHLRRGERGLGQSALADALRPFVEATR